MRRAHLEFLRPHCPACRLREQLEYALVLAHVEVLDADDVREGSLVCPAPSCQREYPILDGIPVVVADLAALLVHQQDGFFRRDDLSPYILGLLGDAAGPGSCFDRERGNNGIYAQSHWGAGGAYPALLGSALAMAAPRGICIDLGSSLGRGTCELARATGQLAVGVDLNFSMLRLAERMRRDGFLAYGERRVGLVFDSVRVEAPLELPRDSVSFWCADVGVLPFPSALFDGALSMNLLDCVPAPLSMLVEMGRVLRPGGTGWLGTPFDWAAGATQPAAWIGGHSQRSVSRGSSLTEFRRLLSVDAAAGVDTGMVIEQEVDAVPWRLRTNERSVTEYQVYLALLRRKLVATG